MWDLLKILVLLFAAFVGYQVFIEDKSINETKNMITSTINETKYAAAEKAFDHELRKYMHTINPKIIDKIDYDRVKCFDDPEYGLSCKLLNVETSSENMDVIFNNVSEIGLQQIGLFDIFDMDSRIVLENIQPKSGSSSMFKEKFFKEYDRYILKTKTDKSVKKGYEALLELAFENTENNDHIALTLETFGNANAVEAMKTLEKIIQSDNKSTDNIQSLVSENRIEKLIDRYVTNSHLKSFSLKAQEKDNTFSDFFLTEDATYSKILRELDGFLNNHSLAVETADFLYGRHSTLSLTFTPKYSDANLYQLITKPIEEKNKNFMEAFNVR